MWFGPIHGRTFTKPSTFTELRALFQVPGWSEHDLGPTSDESMRVLGYSMGDIEAKPVLWIQGAIHGDHEWRTPYYVVEIMKYLSDPGSMQAGDYVFWNQLRTHFAFYFVPCINPWGVLNNSYENANGVNLNRNWGVGWEDEPNPNKGPAPFSEPETQAVRSALDVVKPILFVDWHTWGHDGAHCVIHPPTKADETQSSVVRYMWRQALPWVDVGIAYRNANEGGGGRAMAYAASLVTKEGVKPITLLPEVGGGLLEEDQLKYATRMNMVFLATAAHWSRKHSFPVDELIL